ncbi:molecular chaperone [Shewanella sp.]|uniref:fimbrial biogenesis chaperone n=1 Tax=Shewanella sp. TaxID=50422 RepID=UPI003A8C8548
MRKLFIASVFLLCFNTYASVKPVYTREVIGTEGEYKVDIINTSNANYLVQSWLEDLSGNRKKLPVVITPPIFEIQGMERGIVRLAPITAKLPNDRESIFWLNIQEIPSKTESPNTLKMAIRSRIKIIVRPENVAQAGLEEASKNLKFSLRSTNGKSYLVASNDSPHYLSMGELSIVNDKSYAFPDRFNMVPPFGEQSYLIPDGMKKGIMKIKHGIINDYGGVEHVYENNVE